LNQGSREVYKPNKPPFSADANEEKGMWATTSGMCVSKRMIYQFNTIKLIKQFWYA